MAKRNFDANEELDSLDTTEEVEMMSAPETEGGKNYDLKNVSGTPLFPIFDGEQVTMYPSETVTRDMSTYDECMEYLATFQGGIIVTRIY